MAKLIRIQSNMTINVTSGLQCKDHTNPDAHVPDRLKVSPEWPKATVMIHQGAGLYPVEIKDWFTVKCLAKDKILTLGEIVDSDEPKDVKKCEELDRTMKEIEPQKRGKKVKTLDEITEG